MKLLKRKEIIEMWKKQDQKFLNYYCCPDCRDLLQTDKHNNNYLICKNPVCNNTILYNKEEI